MLPGFVPMDEDLARKVEPQISQHPVMIAHPSPGVVQLSWTGTGSLQCDTEEEAEELQLRIESANASMQEMVHPTLAPFDGCSIDEAMLTQATTALRDRDWWLQAQHRPTARDVYLHLLGIRRCA